MRRSALRLLSGLSAAIPVSLLRTSADLWMNLQKTYELDLARKEAGEEINSIPRRKPARRAAPAVEHSAY